MHQLGIRTHAELTALPASEIDRWRHFFSVEPAGFMADNWRAGVVASTIVNILGRIKPHDQLKPSQLFPDPHRLMHNTGPANPAKARSLLNSLRSSF